ncbi:MAG: hypothetical protein IIU78_04220, partial [Alistipes sp.]|nr:hypothetical protein [Alistipes sp.]
RSMSNDGKQDYSELLAFYKSIGAKGVGEVTSNVYIDSPDMNRIFSACEPIPPLPKKSQPFTNF